MATDEVFMDIPQVQNMAKGFKGFGDVLDGVAKAMEAIAASLTGNRLALPGRHVRCGTIHRPDQAQYGRRPPIK